MPPPSRLARVVGLHALAFLGYCALTLFFLRPAAAVIATHIAPDPGDPLFNLVVLKWGIHELRSGMHSFWDMPFYFPAHEVTTFSDHLLGPAAFAALFTALLPLPLAAYNVLLLGSFVLCGFNTWFVLRRSGLGAAAAFLGGCMFAFSPFRWDQISHLQVLLMQWIPLTLWTWHRLVAAPSWRRAVPFVLFYGLHVTGGCYLAYMIHFPLLVLLLVQAPALWRSGQGRRALSVLLPVAALAALIMAAVFFPYLRASRHRERQPGEILDFGASLASYVTPTWVNRYAGRWTAVWYRGENALFAGILPTVLAVSAVRRGWRRHRAGPRRPVSRTQWAILLVLAGLAAAAFVLGELRVWTQYAGSPASGLELLGRHRLGVFALASGLLALVLRQVWGGNWPWRLGDLDPWQRGLLLSGILCFLLTFPLLYLPLMRVIPGLAGMRVPARFYAFVSFSLVFFAARELDRCLRGRRLATGLVAALLLLELWPRPIEWQPVPREADVAPVYHWLADQKEVAALLELPLVDHSTDILYMYFASFHWKPLVNGYSGYIPDHFSDLMESCCYPLPDPEQLATLRRWGVSHVLLHEDSLDRAWKRRAAREWADQPGVSVEYEDGTDRVYRIAASEGAR